MHISWQYFVSAKEEAESEDEDKGEVKLLNISGKWSAPGSGRNIPQKKIKLATDKDHDHEDNDDFDDEEAEEKATVKKSISILQPKWTKIKPEHKIINTKIKRSRIPKNKQTTTQKNRQETEKNS